MLRCVASLLLLLLSAASAAHDNNFCTISPPSSNQLPSAPSKFYLYLETTNELSGQVTRSSEYFDTDAKRSSFSVVDASGSFRVIVYHDRKQAAVVNNSNSDLLTNCEVQTATEDDLKLGITIGTSRMTVPSVTFFFGKGEENIENKGTEQIDNVAMNKFYSCFYVASSDASVEMTWYFRSEGASYIPYRILVRTKLNSLGITTSATHRIVNYRTTEPHWTVWMNPFIPPAGVYCNGLDSAGRKFNLPTKFSMRLEDKPKNGLGQSSFLEAYDMSSNLTMWEGMPPLLSADPLKYGVGKLQFIHDFRRGVAYVNNLDRGNCTVERISDDDWDSKTENRYRRIRNPAEIFDLDTEQVQYKGTGGTRGFNVDVFIARKRILRDSALRTTTIEWHFANTSVYDPILQSTVQFSAPVMCLVTSEDSLLETTMDIYEFDMSKTPFNQHDITKCFDRTSRKHFQIFFPLGGAGDLIRARPNDFIGTVVPLLIDGLGVGPLRILDPMVRTEENAAVMEVTITDKPSFLSDAEDAPLSDVERNLQNLIARGALSATLISGSDFYSLVANRAVAMDSRDSVAGGYGAGSMVALAFGMAVLGLLIGVAVVFGVYKARGGSLSGLDPFQPQRMA